MPVKLVLPEMQSNIAISDDEPDEIDEIRNDGEMPLDNKNTP